MQYKEIVKKVQDYSGCSEDEAKAVIRTVVESIASKLDDAERKDFGSYLPKQLKAFALAVSRENEIAEPDDIYKEYALDRRIDEQTAKKQIMAVWNVLEEMLGDGQLAHIRGDLPKNLTEDLN